MKFAKGKLYTIAVLVMSLFICFVAGITLMTSPTAAAEEVHYGDGTTGDVYLISSAADLYNLSQNQSDWGKHFKLTHDIDLSTVCYEGVSWTSIGNSTKGFTGTFDGDDHKISCLYIDSTAGWQGLFGYVDNGTIKNLKVEGTVIGNGNVGGIVGYLNIGTVEKCSFEGTVKGGSSSQAVGGIAGYNHFGTIKKCSNRGGVSSSSMYTGGIVGQNYGQDAVVIDCENTATISLIGSASSCSTAGGIVGINLSSSKIINCSNTGKIGEGNYLIIGGIVGSNNGSSVTQCYNTGIVTGSDYIGGVAGRSKEKATITQCYNTGAVSGSQYIGGVAGQNDGATVMNCYNTATVTGSSNVGGLVGKNYEGSSKKPTLGTVKNCYNRGTVTGDNSGGVVGLNKINNSEGTVGNCYYLTNTAVGGINNADTDGATVKTEAVFNSGEIAWLLQHGQATQVWGQWLNGNGHEKQQYPVLTSNLPQRVWKVSFVKNGAEVSTSYVNNDETLTPPAGDEWYDSDGNVFDSNVKVTKDMTLGLRIYFGGMTGSTITTNYGQSIEKNLDELMLYENGSSVEDKFTYSIENNGGMSGASIVGNTLVIPDNANVKDGGYTLQIRAHEKTPLVDLNATANLALTDFGKEDVILSVYVIVNKINQDSFTIKNLPEIVTYGNDKFTLSYEGGSGNGAVTWEVTAGSSFVEIDATSGEVTIKGTGTVEITATKSGGDNYYDISDKITFTVHKANQPAFTIKDLPESVAYNDVFKLDSEGGWADGTVTWAVTDGNSYATITSDGTVTITGVGSITITATKSGGDNYYDISDIITFVANKANQTAFRIIDIPSSLAYGGAQFRLNTLGGSGDGAVTWQVTEGSAVNIDNSTGVVTIVGAGTAEITATKSGGANYYDISDVITVTVHKANQDAFRITDIPSGVAYGGEQFRLNTVGGSGTGEVTWQVTNGNAVSIDIGTGLVTIVGVGEVEITATKSGGANYNDISDVITFTVNKANQSTFRITGLPGSVTYNDEPFSLTTDGGWDGGIVTWEVISGGEFVQINENSGTVTIIGAGEGVVIKATKSGGANYYDISDTVTFTVNKANQDTFKITGLPEEVINGNSFRLNTDGGSGNGAVTWEVTEGKEDATIDSDGYVTIKGAGYVTIVATKAEDNNYNAAVAMISFAVGTANQAPIAIKGLPASVTYGDNGFQLSIEGGSGSGAVTWEVTGGSAVTINVSSGEVKIVGTGEVTITATKAGDEDYNPASAIISFTVNKGNQGSFTITDLPANVAYKDGFVLNTDGGLGTGKVTWEVTDGTSYAEINAITGEVKIIGVGEVTITATKAGDDNYNEISAIISFTVHKANQDSFTICDLPASIAYKDEFALGTHGGSGTGDVTWAVTTGSGIAQVNENTGEVTIIGVGEVTITATKAGDDNYNSASAIVTFTVHKANQNPFTIIDLPASIIYKDSFTLNTDGGSGEGNVMWTVVNGGEYADIGANNGTVNIKGVGEVTITATKAGDENYNSASAIITFTVHKANQAVITITGLASSVLYNDSFNLQTEGGSSEGAVTWEVTEGTAYATITPDGAVTITGAGDITITAIKAGDDNYNSISTIISFTAHKANQEPFTITDLPASIVYKDSFTLNTLGGSGTGSVTWVVSEGASFATVDANGRVTITGVGSVTITAIKAGGANYNDISTIISFNIQKANPEYTLPEGLTAIYGDTLSKVLLPSGWTWDDASLSVGVVGVHTFSATYTHSDTANYNTVQVALVVTVEKATPNYTIPTGLKAASGATLADVKLPDGWTWDDALTTKVGKAGKHKFSATFTPEDTENYKTVTVTLTITVEDDSTFNWWIIVLIIEIIILLAELTVLFIQIRKKNELKKAQR